MRTELFDFNLPEERIALHPASPRDAARMLVVRPGSALAAADCGVRDLPSVLEPGDCLVFNDTRVIPAALSGVRTRADGARADIDANLVERLDGARWKAFARPGKRLREGDVIRFGADADGACAAGLLDATVEARGEGGLVTLRFELSGAHLDAAIARVGAMPLPPYIAARRGANDKDRDNYQTIFAEKDGAVAAPTAALHFTPSLLAALDARGIERVTLTLHVGAGTFLPVKADDTAEHVMHSEWGEITAEAAARLNDVRARGGRICCVGTTALRLIETAAEEDGTVRSFAGNTDIFITPGYRFKATDILMTNFHLPRSTLFMLVSAFSGLDVMKAAYAHAIAGGYRFYSYGDASLLFPSREARGA